MWEERILTSPKIKHVKVIWSKSLSEFEWKINDAIAKGWELYGKPCFNASDFYYATMVKYGEVGK